MKNTLQPPSNRCDKHWFEASSGTCRMCKGAFCQDCLVFPQGPKRPPFCIRCALQASGVRQRSAGGGAVVGTLAAAATAIAVAVPLLSRLA